MSEKNTQDYLKYMPDFLRYFKYIIKKYDGLNKELHLIIIEEYEKEKDLTKVEDWTIILHQHLYRDKNIDFINYWHFWRCSENNMIIPI